MASCCVVWLSADEKNEAPLPLSQTLLPATPPCDSSSSGMTMLSLPIGQSRLPVGLVRQEGAGPQDVPPLTYPPVPKGPLGICFLPHGSH